MSLSDQIAQDWYMHMLQHYSKPERIAFLKRQKDQKYWLDIARMASA